MTRFFRSLFGDCNFVPRHMANCYEVEMGLFSRSLVVLVQNSEEFITWSLRRFPISEAFLAALNGFTFEQQISVLQCCPIKRDGVEVIVRIIGPAIADLLTDTRLHSAVKVDTQRFLYNGLMSIDKLVATFGCDKLCLFNDAGSRLFCHYDNGFTTTAVMGLKGPQKSIAFAPAADFGTETLVECEPLAANVVLTFWKTTYAKFCWHIVPCEAKYCLQVQIGRAEFWFPLSSPQRRILQSKVPEFDPIISSQFSLCYAFAKPFLFHCLDSFA